MIAFESENLWFNKPILNPGEKILQSFPVNHTQGKRAVGGKLFVSNSRLIFVPNRIDAFFKGKTWSLDIQDIENISTESPNLSVNNIFSGAWRKRLRITSYDKNTALFVVNDLEHVIEELNQLTAATRPNKRGQGTADSRRP